MKFRGRLGPESHDDKSIRILNTVVTWTDEGIEYEADQKHADKIIRALGIMNKANVVTPRVEADHENNEEGDNELMEPEDAFRYRSLVARAISYLWTGCILSTP